MWSSSTGVSRWMSIPTDGSFRDHTASMSPERTLTFERKERIEVVARPHTVAEVVRERRVHLIPGVVPGPAAGAGGSRASAATIARKRYQNDKWWARPGQRGRAPLVRRRDGPRSNRRIPGNMNGGRPAP